MAAAKTATPTVQNKMITVEEVMDTFHMVGMGGKDLTLLVSSVIQLGDWLGMFNGVEGSE